jgi:hypothetical protein
MRPQRNVEMRQVFAHARHIPIKTRAIEDQGGCFEIRKHVSGEGVDR